MKWVLFPLPKAALNCYFRSSVNAPNEPPGSLPRICRFPNGPRCFRTRAYAKRCWTGSRTGPISLKRAPTAIVSSEPWPAVNQPLSGRLTVLNRTLDDDYLGQVGQMRVPKWAKTACQTQLCLRIGDLAQSQRPRPGFPPVLT